MAIFSRQRGLRRRCFSFRSRNSIRTRCVLRGITCSKIHKLQQYGNAVSTPVHKKQRTSPDPSLNRLSPSPPPSVFSQWLQTLLACNAIRLFYLFIFLFLSSQRRAGNQAGEPAIIAAATQAVNQLGRQTLLAIA